MKEPLYLPLLLNFSRLRENMTKLEQILKKSSSVGIVGTRSIEKTTLVKAYY